MEKLTLDNIYMGLFKDVSITELGDLIVDYNFLMLIKENKQIGIVGQKQYTLYKDFFSGDETYISQSGRAVLSNYKKPEGLARSDLSVSGLMSLNELLEQSRDLLYTIKDINKMGMSLYAHFRIIEEKIKENLNDKEQHRVIYLAIAEVFQVLKTLHNFVYNHTPESMATLMRSKNVQDLLVKLNLVEETKGTVISLEDAKKVKSLNKYRRKK